MPDNAFIGRIQDIALSASTDGMSAFAGQGMCYLPSGRRLLCDGITVPLTDTSAGWKHLYGYEGPNGRLAAELTAAVPSSPYIGTARTKTGDTTRRYLGSGLVSGGKFRRARHVTVNSRGNFILFDNSAATFNSPPLVLSVTTGNTTPIVVDMSPFVPMTSSTALLQFNNMSNSWLYVARPSMGTPGINVRQWAVAPNSNLTVPVTLDSDLRFNLALVATSLLGTVINLGVVVGGFTVDCGGYYFDR